MDVTAVVAGTDAAEHVAKRLRARVVARVLSHISGSRLR